MVGVCKFFFSQLHEAGNAVCLLFVIFFSPSFNEAESVASFFPFSDWTANDCSYIHCQGRWMLQVTPRGNSERKTQVLGTQ
jgi:hypothetical protein